MTPISTPQAGIDFQWEWIAGYYMRVRKFHRLATLNGDNVSGALPDGTCGFIHAELPNPDVEPEKRIVSIPIQNKGDYKSVFRAHLDAGVNSGVNELVIMYQHRRGFFGKPKPCIHVAGYPAGTWQGFFEAVDRYASGEFRWPPPLFLYSPLPNGPFPAPKGLTKNAFSP